MSCDRFNQESARRGEEGEGGGIKGVRGVRDGACESALCAGASDYYGR